MTIDQILKMIEDKIAELEITLEWMNNIDLEYYDESTFKWYAAQR